MLIKLLLYPEPIIIVILQAMVLLVSLSIHISVAPAVGKLYPALRYVGVVVIDFGAPPSITEPPTPP